MAIADTITSMQTHTSNAYTMIGYGTDLTGINKNLENLSSSIFNAFLEALRTPDTLFTNLPKKSGTGANITLNDTANAPMRIELGATELSQDATPTPSSPQAVHTISGSNKVVVSNSDNTISQEAEVDLGYDNLINNIMNSQTLNGLKFVVNEDKSIYVKGTATARTEPRIWTNTSGTLTLKANQTYYNNTNYPIYIYAGEYIILNANGSYTPTADKSVQFIFIRLENGTTIDTTIYPMLSIYSNPKYTPYGIPVYEYCKIGNYEDKFIRTSGKNLFNPENNVWGKYNVWQNNAGNFTDAFTNTFDVKGGKTCSIKFECVERTMRTSYQFLDDNNNYLSGAYYSIGVKEKIYENISIPATATKCILCQLDGKQTDNIKVQFEYGSTCTDYEPYGSNEWYIKKNIGKVVLDGTETWNDVGITGRYINSQVITNGITSSNTIILISNYFKGIAYDERNNISYASIYLQNNYLGVNNSGFTSTSELQTWLTTHNTSVYYVLATPTYTKITGTLAEQLENVYQKLLSYTGTTNISQVNNDLSFNMSVLAIEEL